MSAFVEKSGTGIHRSGTGIHRSGTGVHKSGTGVRKGGTGSRIPAFLTALVLASATICGQAFASDPEILVSERGDNLMVSLHSDAGIFVGGTSLSSGVDGYFRVGLHQIAEATTEGMVARPLVKASGSGNAGESADEVDGSLTVKASGSGSAGEGVIPPRSSLMVQASGSGSASESAGDIGGSLTVQASGSGNASESACDNPGLLVKASGSGSASESVIPPRSSLMVQASGSGNSGESSSDCPSHASSDLLVELVIDPSGAHILVHDQQGDELLVAFVATAPSIAPDRRDSSAARGFVAAP